MKAPYRVVLSEKTTSLLKNVSARTGLSANFIARFAMLISFENKQPLAEDLGRPGLVINRTTLFGELEPFFMTAYSLSNYASAGVPIGRALSNHIARGAAYLNVRVSDMIDLIGVVDDLS